MNSTYLRFVLRLVFILWFVPAQAFGDDGGVSAQNSQSTVKQDTEVEGNADEKNAESVRVIKYSEQSVLKITSITFTTPKGFKFRPFNRNEMLKALLNYKYVDVAGDQDQSVAFGVVIGPDGAPLEGPDEIKVYTLVPTPENAGTFPLRAEGNLEPVKGGPAKGGPGDKLPAEVKIWRAKVKDVRKGYLKLTADPTYVFRTGRFGQTTPVTLIANAVRETGENNSAGDGDEMPDVPIKLKLQTDLGVLGRNPWQTGVTRQHVDGASFECGPTEMPEAPARATKYVVTATADGYEPASVEISLSDARWIERTPYKGFDPFSNPPWLVVGNGKTSEASSLKLDSAVTANQIRLSVDKDSAEIDPNVASPGTTETNVTGKNVDTPFALAQQAGNPVAKMHVTVKNRKDQNIKFVMVKDPTHSASLTNEQATALINEANGLWLSQAVVNLKRITDGDPWVIDHDMGDKPDLATVYEALAKSHPPQPAQGEIIIFVFWNYDMGSVVAKAYGQSVLMKPDADSITLAHEIGHTLGLGHTDEERNLMNPGYRKGERIRKYQADIANPSTKN